jgi:iron-sulfur cluster assembly accessory protein
MVVKQSDAAHGNILPGKKSGLSPFDESTKVHKYYLMIQITDAAAKQLIVLASEKGLSENGGLRLSVEKGGCAGMQYAMTLGDPQEGDLLLEHLGARVWVDPESAGFLGDSVIDYEDGLSGAGFRIINPRATRSCGCGTSFEPVKEEA